MKIVIDNDGDSINLNADQILQVSRLHVNDTSVSYEMMWACGKTSGFTFNFDKYTIDKKDLIKKVDTIRLDIIKYLNGGNSAEVLFGEINLTKKTDIKEDKK